MFAVVSASLKEWNGNDCVTVETNFPLPSTMLFILKYASHSLDVFADMIRIGELLVKAHTFTQRRTSQNMGINILRMTWTLARKIHSRSFFLFFFLKMGGKYCHLQQLVTAKLFATSRLSMWGVSLNSEVPNWTIPIRNALYSWSAPLGNSPPEIDRNRLSIKCAVFYIKTHFPPNFLSILCRKSLLFSQFSFVCFFFFWIPTNLNTGRASKRASP